MNGIESEVLPCGHLVASISSVHANEWRVRLRAHCARCRHYFFACYAKQLAPEPDVTGNRQAWGPVGRWSFSDGPKTDEGLGPKIGTSEKREGPLRRSMGGRRR